MTLRIEPEDRKTAFLPGETLSGYVYWERPQAPEKICLRLFWYTEGKGDRDFLLKAEEAWESPATSDRRAFKFQLPDGPFSFSGKLISLIWSLELIEFPSEESVREEFILSPTRKEIELYAGKPSRYESAS